MGASIPSDQSNDADEDTPLETDPTGRFQRLNDILGEGAYKNVYRAFDQEEGVEVAWNQLRIDHLTKKEAQKILSEIEILESIRNDHIINFYASWSTKAPNGGERVVFITELMSSGTLKQYLKKTLKGSLKPKVLKSWCRQILQGLVYLHTHNPPIIHRDLKCDNIFINGNNGQLKIGDLGLAVVRHRTHVSSVLGTPEFMAPELYDEKYDEKVDIYAFGMCVLEMVTKEYPYSECTNQAQIYRKVTKGIKPQSLDHVQDPETREFINRCLDHDDRTRPSAQELLDSDFLKPCAILPPLWSASTGLFNYPNRSLAEGMEIIDSPASASVTISNRSSLAEPYQSSATSPSSSYSLPAPLPSIVSRTLPSPKVTAQPISIPGTAFTTTTTVDADNKTYHIRSNLLPQTPTSADQSLSAQPQQSEHHDQESDAAPIQQEREEAAVAEPHTLHSHANSKTCSIQVVQYDEEIGDQLNLKMICTCPVAGPRDVTLAAGTHEIKFPFDLNVDTVEEVVAEMIREQILSADDREEATAKIQDLIGNIVYERKERARAARERSRVAKLPPPQSHGVDHTNRSISTGHKNGHHRQLNIPSVYDLEQYGTSPTESLYDHYSSVGSNASIGWTGSNSPVESDQGYGTVAPLPPQQPPAITEVTFPPLNHAQLSRSKSTEAVEQISGVQSNKQHQVSYSEVVQHPSAPQHPLSPNMNGRDNILTASQSQNAHGVDHRPPAPMSPDVRPAPTNGTLAKLDVATGEKKKDPLTEDVGYTSPYRHGVSSSSIGYHRRSPSMDASVHIASAAPASIPVHISSLDQAATSSSRSQTEVEHHRSSFASTTSIGVSPEIRPTLSRDSSTPSISALKLNGAISQPGVLIKPPNSDSGLSSDASPMTENGIQRFAPVSPSIPPYTIQHDHRVPHSANVYQYDPQNTHQYASVPQQKPLHHIAAEPMMTNEVKKDIESWTSKVLVPERMNGGAGYMNGSNYSSCPEMSDDEDILDEDLKVLRERQRQELELMRLQHVQQWEKMMKLKEQKGLQERDRRKSDANNVAFSSIPPSVQQ
ncbi:Serine/threonine-protein kinase wnk1 [Gamsiella multidivaricata]|nr:Serine/threonine-protein kinase wnk1 [Gamsiella multidivaricata]